MIDHRNAVLVRLASLPFIGDDHRNSMTPSLLQASVVRCLFPHAWHCLLWRRIGLEGEKLLQCRCFPTWAYLPDPLQNTRHLSRCFWRASGNKSLVAVSCWVTCIVSIQLEHWIQFARNAKADTLLHAASLRCRTLSIIRNCQK